MGSGRPQTPVPSEIIKNCYRKAEPDDGNVNHVPVFTEEGNELLAQVVSFSDYSLFLRFDLFGHRKTPVLSSLRAIFKRFFLEM